MPTLKQLNCTLELGSTNAKLAEYGTHYGDGHVSSYIAVPREEIHFSIHLTSNGYVAPGLAMFVYMDGQYQCNRNRRGLMVPGKGVREEQYQVDLRVRQKETKQRDGSFLGRDWTFAGLNLVSADKIESTSDIFLKNMGTIEVVVLRCKDAPLPPPSEEKLSTSSRTMSSKPSSVSKTLVVDISASTSKPASAPPNLAPTKSFQQASSKYSAPPPKKTPSKAPSVKAPSAKAPSKKEESEIGGLMGLFDGASDEPASLDGAADPPPSLTPKPYWSSWNKRPTASPSPLRKQIYIAPEEPLPEVPAAVAKEANISHQVKTGAGAPYIHLCSRPEYLDSMDAPYAVFTFKYRSKKVIEKMFKIKIKEEGQDLKAKLADMSKDELAEELFKMKMQSRPSASITKPAESTAKVGAWGDKKAPSQKSSQSKKEDEKKSTRSKKTVQADSSWGNNAQADDSWGNSAQADNSWGNQANNTNWETKSKKSKKSQSEKVKISWGNDSKVQANDTWGKQENTGWGNGSSKSASKQSSHSKKSAPKETTNWETNNQNQGQADTSWGNDNQNQGQADASWGNENNQAQAATSWNNNNNDQPQAPTAWETKSSKSKAKSNPGWDTTNDNWGNTDTTQQTPTWETKSSKSKAKSNPGWNDTKQTPTQTSATKNPAPKKDTMPGSWQTTTADKKSSHSKQAGGGAVEKPSLGGQDGWGDVREGSKAGSKEGDWNNNTADANGGWDAAASNAWETNNDTWAADKTSWSTYTEQLSNVLFIAILMLGFTIAAMGVVKTAFYLLQLYARLKACVAWIKEMALLARFCMVRVYGFVTPAAACAVGVYGYLAALIKGFFDLLCRLFAWVRMPFGFSAQLVGSEVALVEEL